VGGRGHTVALHQGLTDPDIGACLISSLKATRDLAFVAVVVPSKRSVVLFNMATGRVSVVVFSVSGGLVRAAVRGERAFRLQRRQRGVRGVPRQGDDAADDQEEEEKEKGGVG